MRALVFDDQLTYRPDYPEPTLQPGEALVHVALAGICNTDIEITRGYAGFRGVLGHEFVGYVEAGPADWVGERVVGSINIGCGACASCQQGIPEHCEQRQALGIHGRDGVFADWLSIPVKNLHRVPETISDEAAVFAEPLAAAMQVLRMVHIQPNQPVVLVGAGKLGLLVAQVLRLTACDLAVVVRGERPAALLSLWGIRACSIDEISDRSAQVVVDCSGSPEGLDRALDLVRPRGTVVLKSTYSGQPSLDLNRIAVDEIAVVGSRCGSFAAALRLLESGMVDVLSLIDARYTLEDGVRAFAHASERGVLKVLLS
jgi:threonine dehydrogenase-like Zn-dependent dehydrogenase